MSLPSTYADRNCSLARAYRLTGRAWGDAPGQADPVSIRLNAPRRLLEVL